MPEKNLEKRTAKLAKGPEKKTKAQQERLKKLKELGRKKKEMSEKIASSLPVYKPGKLHEKYLKEVKKIDESTTNKDRSALRNLSILNIRKNPRILIPKKKESNKDRVLNRRAEMVKRIRAYTSKYDKNSYVINYTQVASSHEYKIGLGEIFLCVKRLKIEKAGKKPIIAERMIVPSGRHKGRVGFCDINTKEYVATFSGNKVTILDNKEEVDIKILNKEDEARKAHAKEYKQDKQLQTASSKPRKKLVISAGKIEEIRNKIGGLEGLPIKDRLKKVTEYLTIPENHIGAKHCGNWVERVYAIAGITRKKALYHNIKYAFNNGKIKDGWKPKSDKSRYDARIERKFASARLLNNLQVGDWVYINNRNRYDYAGNHSGIFLGWADKPAKKAIIACWFGNKKGRQKITTYNFNNMPVTHISRGTAISDALPRTTPTHSPEQGGTLDLSVKIPKTKPSEIPGDEILEQLFKPGFLKKLSSIQKNNIGIIIQEFRNAGLPDGIATAAIANSHAESSFRSIQSTCRVSSRGWNERGWHDKKGKLREDSWGLFQMNAPASVSMKKGMTETQKAQVRARRAQFRKDMMNPRLNCRKIIRRIKSRRGKKLREAAAKGASTAELTALFCIHIEIPADRYRKGKQRGRMAIRMFKNTEKPGESLEKKFSARPFKRNGVIKWTNGQEKLILGSSSVSGVLHFHLNKNIARIGIGAYHAGNFLRYFKRHIWPDIKHFTPPKKVILAGFALNGIHTSGNANAVINKSIERHKKIIKFLKAWGKSKGVDVDVKIATNQPYGGPNSTKRKRLNEFNRRIREQGLTDNSIDLAKKIAPNGRCLPGTLADKVHLSKKTGQMAAKMYEQA